MNDAVNEMVQALPAVIEVPTEGARYHAVSHRDWKNLRTKIERLRDHQRQYAAVGWTAVGCAVSALLAALAWYPTYASLDGAVQLRFAWIGPTMLGVAGAGFLAAGLMAWAARLNRSDLKIAVEQLLNEMDEMPLVASRALAS